MPKNTNATYCDQCGAAQTDSAKYCHACGNQLAAAGTTNPGTDEPQLKYQDKRKHSKFVKRASSGNPDAPDTVEALDLHPNSQLLFFITYTSKTGILLLLFAIGLAIGAYANDWRLLIGCGVGLALYIIANIAAAMVAYRHYSFEITETVFRKKYGILHVHTSSIPFDQIENVDTHRGIIDRILGLSRVDIETAGTSGMQKRSILGASMTSSEGHIPGLGRDEAEDIKELVLRRAHQIKFS